ncbi:MAG: iron-containing alcohol dehydrogenase family protein [Synechococcales cyanobacterium]
MWRGWGIVTQSQAVYGRLGERIVVIGGRSGLAWLQPRLEPILRELGIPTTWTPYGRDCAEDDLQRLRTHVETHRITGIVGVGGGKALDTAKLIGHQTQRPVVTIPSSAATCAGWTALSNVYSAAGAFAYDVALEQAPLALLVDYELLATAPPRTLRAGIGDALAKWYEASVSSGHSQDALVIAAVQQARVLRDLLFQVSAAALRDPGSPAWVQAVDACVCLAGVIGGLGGARCRTVAAHAVHNGLTHVSGSRSSWHGEKVAFGILVQLRLEELVQQSQLAYAARRELLRFYREIGLPLSPADLFGRELGIPELEHAAEIACLPTSDIHHLPFAVTPALVVTAMQTTLEEAPSAAVISSR